MGLSRMFEFMYMYFSFVHLRKKIHGVKGSVQCCTSLSKCSDSVDSSL